MKTSRIKHICLSTLTMLILLSCSADIDEISTQVDEKGLWLQPQIAGTDTGTRAEGDEVPGVDSLNENTLSNLDVFIGKDGNFSPLHKRFSSSLTTTDGKIRIASQDWRTEFPLTNYDVYVVANATSSNIPDITSLTQLGLRTQTDDDIYVPHTSTTATDKKFLMYGAYKNWTPSDDESDVITVELNRVAAKIEADLEFGDAITEKYTIGNVTWKLKNCETTGTLLKSYEYPTVGGDNSGDTPLAALNSNTIVTYSYPVMWTEHDDAPYLLINIPLTEKSTGTVKTQNWYRIPVRSINDSEKDLERNHIYYIKAIIASEGSSTEKTEDTNLDLKYSVSDWIVKDIDLYDLEREYLYVVPTLVYMRNIDADNSVTYYASSQVEVVNKEVYYYDENDVKTLYPDSNLVMLTPVNTTNTYDGTINVSSPIPDEEHAGAGTASDLDAGKFTIRFIRFRVRLKSNPDKYEDILIKQYPLEYIQNIKGWYSTRNVDGWIDWIRDSEGYTYREGPKTYGGYYNLNGYNQDEESNVWVNNPKESGMYGMSQKKTTDEDFFYMNCVMSRTSQNFSSQIFSSKVYNFEDGLIYYYSDVNRDTYNNYRTYQNAGYYKARMHRNIYYSQRSDWRMYIGDDNNNSMYVIQLTRTGDKYTIARPTMDSDGLTNDEVASPAFMLASQLGTVTIGSNDAAFNNYETASSYQKFAAKHCATYREVATDGTIYDDWRLPTRSEIGVICEYQPQVTGYDESNDYKDVTSPTGAPITTVLAGSYYFVSNKLGESCKETGRNQKVTGDDEWTRKNLGIRCVRDLTPAEVQKLDENKK